MEVDVEKYRAVIPLILDIAHPTVINVYVRILKCPTRGNIPTLHTSSHKAAAVRVSAPNCFVLPHSMAREGITYTCPGKIQINIKMIDPCLK